MTGTALALPQAETVEIKVGLPARDEIILCLVVCAGEVVECRIQCVGCMELLSLVDQWRPRMRGSLAQLPLPEGSGHAAIMLREAILRAQGAWSFPYTEHELCHCRAVPTAKVDAAVVGGCHNIDRVKRATSASTSCGTCRTDVERVIAYRLRSKSA